MVRAKVRSTAAASEGAGARASARSEPHLCYRVRRETHLLPLLVLVVSVGGSCGRSFEKVSVARPWPAREGGRTCLCLGVRAFDVAVVVVGESVVVGRPLSARGGGGAGRDEGYERVVAHRGRGRGRGGSRSARRLSTKREKEQELQSAEASLPSPRGAATRTSRPLLICNRAAAHEPPRRAERRLLSSSMETPPRASSDAEGAEGRTGFAGVGADGWRVRRTDGGRCGQS